MRAVFRACYRRTGRGQLPARYRYLLPLADPLLGKAMRITLFQARS